jgi:hypothetical protein
MILTRRRKGKGRKSSWGRQRARTIPIQRSCQLLTMHYRVILPAGLLNQEDQDFYVQEAEELDQVDTHFNNIPLTELEGANIPDTQAQKEDQMDNIALDW